MNDRRIAARAALLVAALALACAAGLILSSSIASLAVAALVGLVLAHLVFHGVRHAHLARALRRSSRAGTCDGVPVRWQPLQRGAAVAGIWRPLIFIHPELPQRLSRTELRAVVLHERHHQLRRDPLRLLVFASLAPLVRPLPHGSAWVQAHRANLEIEADRFALGNGVTRSAIARAVLKLGGEAEPTSAAAAFDSSPELRLRALVEGTTPPGLLPAGGCAVGGLLAATTMCVALILHNGAAITTLATCLFTLC